MKIKIRKIDVVIYALFLAIFKIYIIPQAAQQVMKVILLLYVSIFVFSYIKPPKIINMVFLFGCVIVLSGVLSYKAGYVGVQSIYNGLLHALCLYSIYALCDYCASRMYFEKLINCLYKITSLYCILSLISMIIYGHSSVGTEVTYFFGYKFMTSYFFILWVALFRTKYQFKINLYKRYEVGYLIVSLCTLFICRWLYCSTAMLASLLLIIVPFVPKKIKQIAMKPSTIIVTIIAAGILPFTIDMILNMDFVQYIITDVLHKSLNLTGRIKIFAYLEQIVNQRSFIGYGYGNVAVARVVGYGNAQNGLMQLAVDYGYLGIIVFLSLTFLYLRGGRLSDNLEGVYIVLYVMIICSTVEISYNYIFYLILFIIGCFSKCENPNKERDRRLLY